MVRLCFPAVAIVVLAGCNHLPDPEPLIWHHGGDGSCVEWIESRDRLLRHGPKDSLWGHSTFVLDGRQHTVAAYTIYHRALPDTGYHVLVEVDSIGGFYQSWMTGRVRKEWISNVDSVNYLLNKALEIARSDSFLFDQKYMVYLRIYSGHTDGDDPIPSLADVDSTPEFPGGYDSLLAFMHKVLAYPDSEWNASMQGKQFVMFVLETDGSITNLAIRRSITPAMDSASIRAVRSMPRWKPAQIQGKPVPCRMVLPIEWKLIDKVSR